MTIENRALVLDLVEWVASEPRPYAQVMDAWSTSCPRLPIWEDTLDLGFVARGVQSGRGLMVTATESGLAFLREARETLGGSTR